MIVRYPGSPTGISHQHYLEVGDPIFSANALQQRENYLLLIDRYREQLAANGHDPAVGYVGSGSGGLFLADTDE
jgi:hypothetical protein